MLVEGERSSKHNPRIPVVIKILFFQDSRNLFSKNIAECGLGRKQNKFRSHTNGMAAIHLI